LGNNGRGINIEAGWDVLISNSTTVDNGNSGIWLENLPVDEVNVRTTRVQITDPYVYNNGRLVNVDIAGIGIRAVNQVSINGGKIFRNYTDSHQTYGIGLYKGNANISCTNLRILDIDVSTEQMKPVAALDLNGLENADAAAQSGYYRIQSTGNPEGLVSAPTGSEFVDTSLGVVYRKTSGFGTTGWTSFS
jgi:hypothetical protein